MNQRKALQPHEIRVIKIERKAILELLWEILSEISYEKFRLPRNRSCNKKVCIEQFFDESQCEMVLLAHSCAYKVNAEAVIKYPLEAIESLLLNSTSKEYYYSLQGASFTTVHSPTGAKEKDRVRVSALGQLLDKLGIRVRPLKKHEIRVIRLSQQAIHELLWEHFMQTGDAAMDIPEEEPGDIHTIYHMYTGGKLEALTLYVMNFNEASDKAFAEMKEYCDQNIHFTANSYSKRPAKGQNYVSVLLSKS